MSMLCSSFDNEEDAFELCDYADVYKRKLNSKDEDYSNKLISGYRVIYPVWIQLYHLDFPRKGWLCKNLKTGKYRLFIDVKFRRLIRKHLMEKGEI